MKLFLLVATMFVTSLRMGSVHSLPTRAGGCQGDGPAVNGPLHLREGYSVGTLSEGGFAVTLNTVPAEVDTEMQIMVGEIYNVAVRGTSEKATFRGILVRLQTDNMTANGEDFVMEVGAGYNFASECVLPAMGLEHMDPSDKIEARGSFVLLASNTTITVEITIVTANNDSEGSTFFYDSFDLVSVDDVSPTPMPSQSASDSPSMMPSDIIVTNDPREILASGSPTVAPTPLYTGTSAGVSDSYRLWSTVSIAIATFVALLC